MAAVSLPVLGLLLAPAMAACTEPMAVILSARGAVSAGPGPLEAPSPAPHRQLLRSEPVPGEAPAHGGPELGGAAVPGAAGLLDRGRQPILVREESVGKSRRRRRGPPKPAQAGAQAQRGSGTQTLGQLDRDMIMGEVWTDREQVDILALINGTSKLGTDLQELEHIEERKIKDYKSFEVAVGAKSKQAALAAGAKAPWRAITATTYEAAEKVDRDVKLEQVRELQVYHDVGVMNDMAKGYKEDAMAALKATTKVGQQLSA
mmetsp:Transcript_85281/g.249677  ORF Transcript_85281/g.249677 Transcript_85281/m.249677 type:complete len:261 (-) Transcript_85281:320-1102(-)